MSIANETIRLLENRVSIRRFSDKPVEPHIIDTVLHAAFRAPTSSNIQAYSVIVVRNPDTKASLRAVTGNQQHVLHAPVFLAFCADLTRIEHATKKNGHNIENNNLEIGLVASLDAALVGMSAYLAAESTGLRGVMIGAVRNNALETARILGLPHRVYCVYGMCLGWPSETPPQKPRMPFNTIVHGERYGITLNGDPIKHSVESYDNQLANHYRGMGKTTTDDSWSHDMDKKFVPQLRDQLREELQTLGFDFR